MGADQKVCLRGLPTAGVAAHNHKIVVCQCGEQPGLYLHHRQLLALCSPILALPVPPPPPLIIQHAPALCNLHTPDCDWLRTSSMVCIKSARFA